jgi:hypothetical protein
MGLFDKRIAYKPFEYPDYYTEGWLKQAQAFWLHTEISMQSDIKDWNEKLNEKEKHLVGNILLGFAQTECAVSDYWTQKVVGWFPKHEIQLKHFYMSLLRLSVLIILLLTMVIIQSALLNHLLYSLHSPKELVCILLLQFFILFSYAIYLKVLDSK